MTITDLYTASKFYGREIWSNKRLSLGPVLKNEIFREKIFLNYHLNSTLNLPLGVKIVYKLCIMFHDLKYLII